MGFVKIVKNKAYSMRMQVKPKRRRQSKTDYYARRRLVNQDKNKFDSKKYRLVARRTCTKIIAQIIYSTMTGDRVLCAAESTELKNSGLTAGLTNYSAAYATGLLLARRLLKQVGLGDMYKPNAELNGEYFNVDEDVQDKRPFKALLDVGINSTSTGAKVFAVMKGACDGGINVPHKTKRFPGYSKTKTEVTTNKRGKTTDTDKTEATFDASVLRARIFGNHVTTYMNAMKKENPDKFERHFSQWAKCLAAAKVKTCEDLYKKVHSAIIANPDRKKIAGNAKPTRKVLTPGTSRVYQDSKGRKWIAHFRISNQDRKVRVAEKFQSFARAANME
jgi:large subunit ribosomal protein L5e